MLFLLFGARYGAYSWVGQLNIYRFDVGRNAFLYISRTPYENHYETYTIFTINIDRSYRIRILTEIDNSVVYLQT